MKVFVASDHVGFELKNKIKDFLSKKGASVEDCGAHEYDKNDDYPDFISKAAINVSKNPGSFGIIFGGSGQAEMMTANKVKGIRCALYYGQVMPIASVDISGRISSDPQEIVKLSREHNDANMLSIGARFVSEEDSQKAIALFLSTDFPGDERHIRRIKKMGDIESGLRSDH